MSRSVKVSRTPTTAAHAPGRRCSVRERHGLPAVSDIPWNCWSIAHISASQGVSEPPPDQCLLQLHRRAQDSHPLDRPGARQCDSAGFCAGHARREHDFVDELVGHAGFAGGRRRAEEKNHLADAIFSRPHLTRRSLLTTARYTHALSFAEKSQSDQTTAQASSTINFQNNSIFNAGFQPAIVKRLSPKLKGVRVASLRDRAVTDRLRLVIV
jgi:hypothetical protein